MSARVDALATEPHYLDHLQPVMLALPQRARGSIYLTTPPPADTPTLVASWGDLRRARAAGRPVIFMEHGAGQSYRHPDGRHMRHPSFPGGPRPGALLILVPGAAAARAYREVLEPAPVVEVGIPKLDAVHREPFVPPLVDGKPVVALSFHWDCHVAPETAGAWREYLLPLSSAATQLARIQERYHVLGHGHPRLFNRLWQKWEHLGVEPVASFDEVIRRAHVYAVDNSSTLFEFASLGRPVVQLHSRHYRRGVEHGLRFWQAQYIGPTAHGISDLFRAINDAWDHYPEERQRAVKLAYRWTDGGAAGRAARAIMEVVDARPH